tara:strand:+ start:191 stop:532 length:342 start_codon:yes stop_codon:yes gene_type:complete
MSKRKGPLTKAEKFYIDNHLDTPVKELAEELNRSEKIVKNRIGTQPEDSSEQTEEDSSMKVGNLMARKEDRGVTTMTPQASMLADEKRPEYLKNRQHNRHSQSIHKIKPDNDS